MFRSAAVLGIALAAGAPAADIAVVPEGTRIPPGQTASFEFGNVPQHDTTVTLEITARMDFRSLSGSTMFMRMKLNGRPIKAAKSRTVPRLSNRPLISPVAPNLPSTWCDGDHWRLLYAPDFEVAETRAFYVGDPYTYILDVTDLINPASESRLEITNTASKHSRVFADGGGSIVVKSAVVRTRPGQSPTMAVSADIKPVTNNGQPGAGPAPYRGVLYAGGGFTVTVGDTTWAFSTGMSYPNAGLNRLVPDAEVDRSGQPDWSVRVEAGADGGTVSAAGSDYTLRRTVRFTARKVAIADTVTNDGDAPLGLLVRHDLGLEGRSAAQVRIAGNPDPSIDDYHAPGNPSVHVALGDTGLGMICEDTVFRNQARLFFENDPPRAGVRTDMLHLPSGGSCTLEWSVYPVASRDYYDFVNLVRADWDSNFTVEGPWAFFDPDTIIAQPVDELRAHFDRLGINYACYCGGWVDRKHDKKKIGFGTGVMDPYWSDFRRRLKEATAKLRVARPDIKVLVYYDTQRDTSDGGEERFRDSWLTGKNGGQFTTNWGGVYSLTRSVVATLDNSFGKAMLGLVDRYLDEMGIDGLYWDEMECTGYGAPLLTHNVPDGYSCILDPKTYTIVRTVGNTALLGETHRLAVIDRVRERGGTLMGNGPALTRDLLHRRVQRMVEVQHNDYWSYQGDLGTPLGYASWRTDFGNWIRALKMARLLVGTRYTYEHEISPYVFPFTPVELHYGYLLGRERIITLHSGSYGWQDDAGLVVCHQFDREGKRRSVSWPTVLRGGTTKTAIELDEDEVAVLVRTPWTVSGADGTTIRNVALDGGRLTVAAAGTGVLELRSGNVRHAERLQGEPTTFTVRTEE